MTELQKKIEEVKSKFKIYGNSTKINSVIESALKVAPTPLNVLIMGENGTGKELIARIIHAYSDRRDNKFIIVNCGALPEGTINSELFGHEKGAFTGAFYERKGYFEEANEGTLLLDEIVELPYGTQTALLRAIETGEIVKMGAPYPIKTNVRVIATTNKNIFELVNQKKFREDLFYRVANVIIKVPPLRERQEDIPYLVKGFLLEIYEEMNIKIPEVSDEALIKMASLDWFGNVRQLKNLIKQIIFLETPSQITPDLIEKYYYSPQESTPKMPIIYSNPTPSNSENSLNFNVLMKLILAIKKDTEEILSLITNFDKGVFKEEKKTTEIIPYPPKLPETTSSSTSSSKREMIINALRKCKGKRSEAAKELGVSTRTLYRMLKKYNISDDDIFGI